MSIWPPYPGLITKPSRMLIARGKGLSTPNEAPASLHPYTSIATRCECRAFHDFRTFAAVSETAMNANERFLVGGGGFLSWSANVASQRVFFFIRFYLVSASWKFYGISLCM